VTRHASPADRRPFKTKAELQNQEALEDRYGAVAIQDIVDALRHIRASADRETKGRKDQAA
jgi:hypothetical protein